MLQKTFVAVDVPCPQVKASSVFHVAIQCANEDQPTNTTVAAPDTTVTFAAVVVCTQTRTDHQEVRQNRKNGNVQRPEPEREGASRGVTCVETHCLSRPHLLWRSADTASSLFVEGILQEKADPPL